MSIIIAKIEGNSCSFKSDTKVSILNGDKSVTGDDKIRLNPNEGVLKIHIIHPAICVAFAGNIDVCVRIIHNLCRYFPLELNEILNFLKESLFKENDDSEFILSSYYYEKLELYKISKQKIEKGNSFWIGVKEAFEEFQTYYNDEEIKNNTNRFSESFKHLINNSKISTIGDFIISSYFRFDHKCFVYEESLFSQSGYGIIHAKENTATILSEGTTSEGSFTVTNLVSDKIMRPAICLYFDKGQLAYLYFPISNLVKKANPIIIKDISLEDLKSKVLKEDGINLIGISLNLGSIRFVR